MSSKNGNRTKQAGVMIPAKRPKYLGHTHYRRVRENSKRGRTRRHRSTEKEKVDCSDLVS